MSDNEDLLGDDLGDQSLADYNLGNEEEDQLLADDYENGPQNVPNSVGPYREMEMVPPEYPAHVIEFNTQPLPYQQMPEPECVVPNITVEVPNAPIPERPTYAPYEPRYDAEHAVPPAIPASPIESPQIVPSDMNAAVPSGDRSGRARFVSERPPQRTPQVRDIPDSLDKVVIPRGSFPGRGRSSWRAPHFAPRPHTHPYRRHNLHRGNFNQRPSFPPPQMRFSPPQMRPEMRFEMRPDIRPEMRPEIRTEGRPEMRPENMRPDMPEMRPNMPPSMRPDMPPTMRLDMPPSMRPDMPPTMRPDMHHEIRPEIEIRPEMRPMRHEMPPDMRPDLHPDRPIRINMRNDVPDMRQDIHPDMRLERPEMRSERPDMHPELRPPPQMSPEHHLLPPPQMGPEISPERPIIQDLPVFRPQERPPFPYRIPYRPNMDERFRPNFEPRPFFRPNFPRPFGPIREIVPNTISHMPQVTIRQPIPEKDMGKGREPEVRMLPVSLPPSLPPGGLAGKKVLINPHFKGNYASPSDGLPTYIPTRIQKTPPLSPTIESKFGPVKDIDDAAERFIAEQRDALARAETRKYARRSPQRYIENTTIEIENDLARGPPRRKEDDDLSRRQEEFINANRAGLRRRMRSPSPARRSPSPARARRERDDRRPRPDPARHDEDSEYKRKLREQESLRERVLRAKEVRRRKNAVALHNQLLEKERENQDKENKEQPNPEVPETTVERPSSTEPDIKPDTTRTTPEKTVEKKVKPAEKLEKVEKVRDRSPVKQDSSDEVNSTRDNLTPPPPVAPESPERALTPPLPDKRTDSDDDLDLILGDIDGILSDDDDSGRFKKKAKKAEDPKPKPATDLRARLPPKTTATADKKQRQKIVFTEDKKKKEKSPARRPLVLSSTGTKQEDSQKHTKTKQKAEVNTTKSRQRITFDKKEPEKEEEDKKPTFSNRRVILQRKASKDKSVFSRIEVKSDPTQPNAGIFSRAVRTAIGTENTRIVVKKETEIQYESESDLDEETLLADDDCGNMAAVTNLPFGMTDTRLKTLAGNDVQTMTLDKEERSAKITFKTTEAADNFKKKFNNKMVAASRLTVTLR